MGRSRFGVRNQEFVIRRVKYKVPIGHSGEDAKQTTEETTPEAEQGGSGLEKQSRRSGGHSVSRPGTSQRSVRWRSSSKGNEKEHPAGKAKHLKPNMTQQSVGQMLPRVTGARGCRQ